VNVVRRPYRFAPPQPARSLLRRSQLLRRLDARWDKRITLLLAGAGFGKTSLLAQAVEENRQAPRGDDRWFGCGPGDTDPVRLAEGLAMALDAELPPRGGPKASDSLGLATALSDAVWRRSPRHVCLIMDDVHEIPPRSASAELIGAVTASFPTNGHLVLACRHEAPIPLSRADVQGRILRLDEDDLAFAPDELTQFAALREIPPTQLDGVGGWPALAELRTLGVHGQIDDFLAEEVLTGLSDDERRLIATVAAMGGADTSLLAEVTGRQVDLPRLLARIPLVSRDESGWHTIHAVWSAPLSRLLGANERQRVQRDAGLALLERDFPAAMKLLIAADDHAAIEHALRSTCSVHGLPATAEGLERLHGDLPQPVRSSAVGDLLAAIATVTQGIDRGIARLEGVLDAFERAGDASGTLLALEHLALCHMWREDAAALASLWARLDGLAAHPEARGLQALGRAVIADTQGDAQGVLDALDSLDAADHGGVHETADRQPMGGLGDHWTAYVAWLRGTALFALGYPDAARRQVEVAVARASPWLRGALSMLLVNSLRQCHDDDRAFAVLDRLIDELEEAGNAHTACLGHCHACGHHALAGRIERAREHLSRARAHAGPAPNAPAHAAIVAAEAMLALAEGDEGRAATLFAEQIEGREVGEGRQRYGDLRRLPLLYVLLPDTRAYWDSTELGPCYLPGRDLARALVALRQDQRLDPAADLSPQHWSAANAFLPRAWHIELAVAALAGGNAQGDTIVREMGSEVARPVLRALGDRGAAPHAMQRWSMTLLDSLPAVPPAPLEVGVLGPTTLRRDGRVVEHPHWRRERVRALLLLLLARGGGAREEIAGALWPDLDEEAAGRNLRVTLSYLLAVLEPDREEGAPSFYVRSEGASLRLAGHEWLQVDAWDMERLLDAADAADRAGEPSSALTHYREAVALYRGPYLAEAGYEQWALPHRDRLSARFVVGAVRAGELTLAGDNADEALRLAARALEVEPYSEPAHRLVVAAHAAHGDLAAARRAIDTCLQQLDELGVTPTEDTRMVLASVLSEN
jgi:LuxR family transcriptional regulator, maltose regulon positive regulatory protein